MSESNRAPIVPIRCKCKGCGTPVASLLSDGRIAIAAVHHSERHLSVFTLGELADLLRELRGAREPA